MLKNQFATQNVLSLNSSSLHSLLKDTGTCALMHQRCRSPNVAAWSAENGVA